MLKLEIWLHKDKMLKSEEINFKEIMLILEEMKLY